MDFQAGYCCSATDGCSEKIMQEAPLCSDTVTDELLKYFVCPSVKKCGQKVIKAVADRHVDISINPFDTFMDTGDKCSYLLSVDEFSQGDRIELSAIDSSKIDLQLFHGGYSLASSLHRTHLENGKRYLVDGSQKLFLIADAVHTPSQGKPYFSLAMKKIAGSSITEVNEAIASLTDTSILADAIHEDPLTVTTTITVEKSNNDDTMNEGSKANISTNSQV